MNRDPAMLTPDQRAYLRGEKDYDTNVESNVRYAIRERVRASLADFALLLEAMETRDREQIFKDLRPAGLRDDPEATKETYREDELGALVQTLGFLYRGAQDAGIPFEKAIEQGITVAGSTDRRTPFAPHSVDVTIEEELDTDIERLFGKIERGEPLDDLEYFGLLSTALSDPAAFNRTAAGIDTGIEAKLDAGESLDRGESIVAVGKVSRESIDVQLDELLELMHDDVVTHLGLSNARSLLR